YRVGQAHTSSYTTSVPQWGQTGYSSAHTSGMVTGNYYSANTYYTPTYGITGYQQISNSVTSYPLAVFLNAATRDETAPDQTRHLWQLSISASSRTGDLRSAFPFMLYGAAPFLGTDSGGVKSVQVPHTAFSSTPQ